MKIFSFSHELGNAVARNRLHAIFSPTKSTVQGFRTGPTFSDRAACQTWKYWKAFDRILPLPLSPSEITYDEAQNML